MNKMKVENIVCIDDVYYRVTFQETKRHAIVDQDMIRKLLENGKFACSIPYWEEDNKIAPFSDELLDLKGFGLVGMYGWDEDDSKEDEGTDEKDIHEEQQEQLNALNALQDNISLHKQLSLLVDTLTSMHAKKFESAKENKKQAKKG